MINLQPECKSTSPITGEELQSNRLKLYGYGDLQTLLDLLHLLHSHTYLHPEIKATWTIELDIPTRLPKLPESKPGQYRISTGDEQDPS